MLAQADHGLLNLYDFLGYGVHAMTQPMASRIDAASVRTSAIVEAGMDPRSGSILCAEGLRMFTGILG
jgi:hypothetical protein